MKIDSLPAFSKHLRGAFPGHLLPVYLLLSKDEDALREAWRQFKEIVLKKTEDFSHTHVSLEKQKLSSLLHELSSRSFFSDKRVVSVDTVEKLKREEVKTLSAAILKKDPSVLLVLLGCADPSLKPLSASVEKEGIVLALPEVKAWQKEKALAKWLEEAADEKHLRLERGAAEELLRHVGCDRGALLQEMEKLQTFVGNRKNISLRDIRLLTTADTVESIWEFYDTLFSKNTKASVEKMHALLQDGLDPISFIRQLRTQVQTYFCLSDLSRRKATDQEIAKAMPKMQGFILKKSREKVRNFTAQSFAPMLLAVDKVDLQLRTSPPNIAALLDQLIVTICHLP